jgi:hypothetical protein
MSYNTGNKQIILSGVMVGIGLVAVAMAIFTRLPIGSEFVKALRQGSERRSGARVVAPPTDRISVETAYASADYARPELVNPRPQVEMESKNLPSSVTITKTTEISMGISKFELEVGNILPVVGRKGDLFICEYLGDTVKVPISATNWESPDAP